MQIERFNKPIAVLSLANHTVPHLVADPVDKEMMSRVWIFQTKRYFTDGIMMKSHQAIWYAENVCLRRLQNCNLELMHLLIMHTAEKAKPDN